MESNISFIENTDSMLEVRDLEKRELFGRIIPYGDVIQIRGRDESFAKGSVSHLDPNNSVLLLMHDQAKPVGRMTALEERADGAYATFRVARTLAGDELLQLASEKVLTGFSAGFFPDVVSEKGVHQRIKALPEVSVVTFGAYANAQILSVRNSISLKEENFMDKEMKEEVVAPVVETVADSIDWEKRFHDLGEKIQKLETSNFAPVKEERQVDVRPVDWFVAEVEDKFRGKSERKERLMENLEKRAIADAVGVYGAGGAATGLIENNYLGGEMVNFLNGSRPLFGRIKSFEMPKSGSALIPSVTTHTTAAVRATQAAEPNSTALVVSTTAYTAKWYSGALQISYELMATAEFDVLEMVFNDLVKAYGKVTESAAITDIEAAATASGAVITMTNYGTAIADIITQSEALRTATGSPASKVAVPLAQWKTWLSFVDGSGRRHFANGDYTDGVTGLTSESLFLAGGIEVFPAGVTQALVYNDESLRVAEAAPLQLEAVNIAQVTKDVAILGRTLIVPRVTAGIIKFAV